MSIPPAWSRSDPTAGSPRRRHWPWRPEENGMAEITLKGLAHSYRPHPEGPADYALKKIDHVWRQGGAYALLGPSGCGKTTLLNIISGLVEPSEGSVLFDGRDVTRL